MNFYITGNTSRVMLLEVICDKHMNKSPAYPKEVGKAAAIFYGLKITKISEDQAKKILQICGLDNDPKTLECDWCRRATETFGGRR